MSNSAWKQNLSDGFDEPKKKPKSTAERCKEYRKRKKREEDTLMKEEEKKKNAKRIKQYRERKKRDQGAVKIECNSQLLSPWVSNVDKDLKYKREKKMNAERNRLYRLRKIMLKTEMEANHIHFEPKVSVNQPVERVRKRIKTDVIVADIEFFIACL